jgi:hypothetical protein
MNHWSRIDAVHFRFSSSVFTSPLSHGGQSRELTR